MIMMMMMMMMMMMVVVVVVVVVVMVMMCCEIQTRELRSVPVITQHGQVYVSITTLSHSSLRYR